MLTHVRTRCSSRDANRYLGCGTGIFFSLNLTTSHINLSLSCKKNQQNKTLTFISILLWNTRPCWHFCFCSFFPSLVFLVNYLPPPPFWKWKHIVSRRIQLRYRFWVCAVKSLRVPPFMGSRCRHAPACSARPLITYDGSDIISRTKGKKNITETYLYSASVSHESALACMTDNRLLFFSPLVSLRKDAFFAFDHSTTDEDIGKA